MKLDRTKFRVSDYHYNKEFLGSFGTLSNEYRAKTESHLLAPMSLPTGDLTDWRIQAGFYLSKILAGKNKRDSSFVQNSTNYSTKKAKSWIELGWARSLHSLVW